MSVAIQLDQPGNMNPPVAGFAREDFVTGTPVNITLVGGPFLAQVWQLVDKPIDLSVPAQSNAGIVSPTAPSTSVQPIDRIGTYLLKVAVDSGFGLGANPEDNASITFYAGDPAKPLATQWDDLPRRVPAFLERLEHNVKGDAIFGVLGNKRGWAQEWLRWFGVLASAYIGASKVSGLVQLTGMAATLLTGRRVATVLRTGVGTVAVTFSSNLATPYIAKANARGATGGTATIITEVAGGFTVVRADPFGALVDADFTFSVEKP